MDVVERRESYADPLPWGAGERIYQAHTERGSRGRRTVRHMRGHVWQALRGFAHRLAHLLDDRQPSRRSDLLIRGEDGDDQMIIPGHDGSASGR